MDFMFKLKRSHVKNNKHIHEIVKLPLKKYHPGHHIYIHIIEIQVVQVKFLE